MSKIPTKLPKEITDKYSIISNAFKLDKIKNPELDKIGEPKDEINVIIGDDKQPDKFYPQIKLQRWTNEVNFSVRLIENEIGEEKIETIGDKIKWSKGNIDIEYYDYPEGEGGMKMIPYLKAKPTTNQIRFSVKRKGLSFYKQLPLTQKEIDDGCVRPPNVVNSFAIYHNTKGGMVDSYGKDYKIGKFGHDFTPKLIDANGWEIYGDLDYIWFDEENGERIITIPQDFLDKAVYPIKSNDTFGYTTKGTGGGWSIGDRVGATKATAPSDVGSVTLLHAALKSINGKNAQLQIYQYISDINAGSKLVESSQFLITSNASWEWHETAVDYLPTANTNYFLSAFADEAANDTVAYDIAVGWYVLYDGDSFPTAPTTLYEASYADIRFSIYCTYTPAAAGTNTKINIGDIYKDVDSLKINIGDVYKDVIGVQQNIGDVWKTVF